MSDDNATPPAPSLAERVAERLRLVWDLDKEDTTEVRLVVEQMAKAEVAALRAVEAVRASKIADGHCILVCDPEDPRGWHTPECRAYREGVEDVQALLEGEK